MIKARIALLSFLAITQFTFAQNGPIRVLFIGNSYTGTNSLPTVFEEFSNAAGDSVVVDWNTPGGFTFQGHSTNSNTINKISQGHWDYVVLQEQSQIPSFPISQVQTMCFPYATQLDQMINTNNECAETVFYMTWGRENGDASNCANWPPVCTYQGMDDLLRERYLQMADDNNAIVSPVGAVWRYIRTNLSSIDLYTGDGSHPAYEGTYAAACAFYSVIHRADPSLVNYDGSLSALTAFQIRAAAKVVAFDSLSNWFVGDYDTIPTADFDWDSTGLQVDFTNLSTQYTSVQWDFGDGNSSTDVNPSHTYNADGAYEVSLTAYHCDSTDVYLDSVFVGSGISDTTDTSGTDSTVFVPSLHQGDEWRVYPNPTNDVVFLSGPDVEKVQLFDVRGVMVLETRITNAADPKTFSVSGVPPGHYIMRMTEADRVGHVPLIIAR